MRQTTEDDTDEEDENEVEANDDFDREDPMDMGAPQANEFMFTQQ